MKIRWLIALLVALVAAATMVTLAAAAPAAPIDITLTQPDGSTFTARQWGDEWSNGMETLDGYTIMQAADGWWVYAAVDGGALVPALTDNGRLVVGLAEPPASALHLRPDVSYPESLNLPLQVEPNSHNIGTQPTLVLLASFSNRASTYTADSFAASMFGASNSVSDYYLEASFNQLTLSPAAESHGTTNDGVIGWLNLGYPHPNTGSVTSSANQLIVKNALIAADPYVNYASYDTNSDGYISINELHLVVVVAGYEAAYNTSTPSIWAHRWSLNDVTPPTLDGKILGEYSHNGGYAQFGEIHGDHPATIGIMAHELGHDITWPDLYDTDGSSDGVGRWSIMGSGNWNYTTGNYYGSSPALPDAWLKWYQGWITPTTVSGTLTNQAIPQAETNSTAFLLRPNSGGVNWEFGQYSGTGEFFLVENRQLTGYDAGLPGCGLLIWHIDESVTYTNSANDNEYHPLVKLMQADGLDQLMDGGGERGDPGDPFPGSANNTAFTYSSVPNSRLYSGSDSLASVTAISAGCAATKTATLTYGGTTAASDIFLPVIVKMQPPVPVNPIRNGTFEAGADGNWSQYSSGGWPLITQTLPGGVAPHGGSWAVWMGGAPSETAQLTQSGISMAGARYLHYWYWIASEDMCGYDYAGVFVNGSLLKQYDLCSNSNTGGWVHQLLDLNAYAGTTITLTFAATTDGSLNSNFLLDDVSIGAATALQPMEPQMMFEGASAPR
ncbi:MAG TPA: M6 family metalloprotease domain-containing protein [Anaerolineaceae bacterium]|nr:M6 family metalloprotease domain-containing protein [Anaerolineaceae bacterium]